MLKMTFVQYELVTKSKSIKGHLVIDAKSEP